MSHFAQGGGRQSFSLLTHLAMSRVVALARRPYVDIRLINAFRVEDVRCRSFSLKAGSNAVLENFTEDAKAPSQNSSTQIELTHPTYMIWGSNTGVGKTLVSAGLSGSILSNLDSKMLPMNYDSRSVGEGRAKDVLYLKPVQTGFPRDSDASFVTRQVSKMLKGRQHGTNNKIYISNHTLKASPAVHQVVNLKEETGMKDLGAYEELVLDEIIHSCPYHLVDPMADTHVASERNVSSYNVQLPSHLACKTLWAWFDAVSAHSAAQTEKTIVDDSSVLESLLTSLQSFLKDKLDEGGLHSSSEKGRPEKWVVIETAGGVASPGPSGTLQCDLYRPLRFPGVLVGDGRLGGVSGTIAAYESLHVRGYDITAVILIDTGLSNEQPLLKYLQGRIPVLVLPPVPENPTEDLAEWFVQSEVVFSQLQGSLEEAHLRRVQRLHEMPKRAGEVLWWPFTQHTMVRQGDVTVIDSRCGETFSVHKNITEDVLVKQFDGCASWWTQGPDARLQPELAREAAYAAGRYGHVMFPENVYEPALRCAELLLDGMGKGWAKRVYFSDNGSTAIEIALKMAFRKFVTDKGSLLEADVSFAPQENQPQLKVLALSGSYHGDTLGAMDAQAPSPYTGFRQQPWYSGRGLFVDPPIVYQHNSQWLLRCPESLQRIENYTDVNFKSREDIFDLARDRTNICGVYETYIQRQFFLHETKKETDLLAALIIEPGGMEMVDPLFQRCLVHECQHRNIPVIFDEVFVGCWRLGVKSASELLNCYPDIACYAKLLTGGTIPLAATLATESVFEAFSGNSKLDALLHGHSYSAHAIGCATAVTSMEYFNDRSKNLNLQQNGRLQELWDSKTVAHISCHPSVERVVSLGTLFACELLDNGTKLGYGSTSTRELIRSLRADGIYTRPLGNVVYLMCGPLTPPQTCSAMLEIFQRNLG